MASPTSSARFNRVGGTGASEPGPRNGIPWKDWGPYLSERQWGTVREDYSTDGNAWDYSATISRARAPIAGARTAWGGSRTTGSACVRAGALERARSDPEGALFGPPTARQPRRGREGILLLRRLDADALVHEVPLQVPQREYPYRDLIENNRRRSREEFEYELVDTGVFDEDRYFDVFVEYAKARPDDVLIRITVHNRGPRAARPTRAADAMVSQYLVVGEAGAEACPARCRTVPSSRPTPISASTAFACEARRAPLHRERNQQERSGSTNGTPWVKEAFHRYVVTNESEAVNPARTGTKAAAHCVLEVPAGGARSFAPRLSAGGSAADAFGRASTRRRRPGSRRPTNSTNASRRASLTEDERRVHRQALAGMLWSKQCYLYDVDTWLKEHDGASAVGQRRTSPQRQWFHMFNGDVISMPESGSTRGTPPGTWRSTPSRSRSSTSTSQRSSSS